ncbi:hypothetical protein ABZ572_34020 [Streptomyces sp. NPDC018338]
MRVWAARAADAIREAGGRVSGTVRISLDHVERARDAYREAVAVAVSGGS